MHLHARMRAYVTGGVLWFSDLTQPDATLTLPLMALALTYANLELSLTPGRQPLFLWFKVYWTVVVSPIVDSNVSLVSLSFGLFVVFNRNSGSQGQGAVAAHLRDAADRAAPAGTQVV